MKDIRTQHLLLSPLTTRDASFILELVNTPGWLKFIGDRGIHTTDAAVKYLEEGPRKSYANHGFGLLKVSLGNTPIGMCGLLQRDYLPSPDLGFAFLPGYEGKGYAYEAAHSYMRFIQQEHPFTEIHAITVPENERSIRLLEKLGFVYRNTINITDTVLSLYSASIKNG